VRSGYAPAVVEPWIELDRDAGRQMWSEFADRYQFHAGTSPDRWPAILEGCVGAIVGRTEVSWRGSQSSVM
jgi:hypothetical protein